MSGTIHITSHDFLVHVSNFDKTRTTTHHTSNMHIITTEGSQNCHQYNQQNDQIMAVKLNKK
jgi:hypothetical protein